MEKTKNKNKKQKIKQKTKKNKKQKTKNYIFNLPSSLLLTVFPKSLNN